MAADADPAGGDGAVRAGRWRGGEGRLVVLVAAVAAGADVHVRGWCGRLAGRRPVGVLAAPVGGLAGGRAVGAAAGGAEVLLAAGAEPAGGAGHGRVPMAFRVASALARWERIR